ncbi:hypothetical protein C0993_005374 [Termitomyces sp. T159_Od127]|nr:hypothetical protein C0993_005374 [Termitomyces sp. T159_Od127]
MGFPMQMALTILDNTSLSNVAVAFNPFAHFILIHTILRNIYVSYTSPSSNDASTIEGAVTGVVMMDEAGEIHTNSFGVQFALHNWFQTWLGSPESMSVETSEDPPFIRNALPFYWLAQVSLLMVQDGSVLLGQSSFDEKAEERFRRVKKLLYHIQVFLKDRDGRQPYLWDELVKLRVEMSVEHAQSGDDDPKGLLSFLLSSGS